MVSGGKHLSGAPLQQQSFFNGSPEACQGALQWVVRVSRCSRKYLNLLVQSSRPIFGLGSCDALEALLRVAEDIGVGGADDAPAARDAAEQVALAHLDRGDPMTPGQYAGELCSRTELRVVSSVC